MNPKEIDINTASLEELCELPKIGPALAEAIIALRPYKNLRELAEIKGISPRLVEQLGDQIKISPLDPNMASYEELEQLPRITPQVAARIVSGRPYHHLEELREIKGVGKQVFQLLKPHLSIFNPIPIPDTKPEPIIVVGDHVQSILVPDEAAPMPAARVSSTPEQVQETELPSGSPAQPQPPAAPHAAPPATNISESEAHPNRAIQIIAPETAYNAQPAPVSVSQPPSWRRAEWLPWILLSSLVVFILTTVVILGLFAVINGGLQYASREKNITLQTQFQGLSDQLATMQTQLTGLRERLTAVEDLGTRVGLLENERQTYQNSLDNLTTQVDQFQQQIDDLSAQTGTLEQKVTLFQQFMDGLRSLLGGLTTPLQP